MRKILWGFFGLAALSCGGIGQVEVRQGSTDEHLAVPRITAERLQECVKEYGNQLEGGSWAFSPTLQVNQEGYVVSVDAGQILETAPDFAACTRSVIGDMAIPSSIFKLRPTESATSTKEPTIAQRSFLGNPAVAVVVVVGLSELVFEAGATTILFAVTVEVVDKAAKDVAELAKRGFKQCVAHYTACMATVLSNPLKGNHWKASRCNVCLERCRMDGVWPDAVGNGDCAYLNPNW